MSLLDTYNQIYSKVNTRFCPPLTRFIEEILLYKKNGNAVDIGAGRGQNVVFLAENGYTVDALDFSEESVKRIEEVTLPFAGVTAQVFDIKTSELEKDYDVIFCNFTLHHFNKKERKNFFNEIKKHTKIGGLNLLSVLVSPDGSEQRNHGDISVFYLHKEELKEVYHDWEILKFEQEKEETTDTKTGKTEIEILQFILAKK